MYTGISLLVIYIYIKLFIIFFSFFKFNVRFSSFLLYISLKHYLLGSFFSTRLVFIGNNYLFIPTSFLISVNSFSFFLFLVYLFIHLFYHFVNQQFILKDQILIFFCIIVSFGRGRFTSGCYSASYFLLLAITLRQLISPFYEKLVLLMFSTKIDIVFIALQF